MTHSARPIAGLVAAIAALTTLTPLHAAPSDYAGAIADRARAASHRALDESREPAAILDFAGVTKGQVVQDFFAGDGYYSELLSRAVGPKGIVYATNPPGFHDPKPWQGLQSSFGNVRMLVAEVPAMQFAPGSIDLVLTHLNYHDLYWQSEKYKFPKLDVPAVLTNWYRALRPGGHVIIVDHAGPAGDPRDVVERLHRIDPARVKADMAAAGFVLEAESDVLHRSSDSLDKGVFDPAVRGKTDRFVLKFRRP